MYKVKNLCLILFSTLIITSCASNPKTMFNDGIFCGLIVDQNNCPVPEYIVKVSTLNTENLFYTNENGIFYVPEIEAGKVWIEGKKSGYQKIKEEIQFEANQKMFCWQVLSAEVILANTERYVKLGDLKNAQKELDSLEVEKKTLLFEKHNQLIKELKTATKNMERK